MELTHVDIDAKPLDGLNSILDRSFLDRFSKQMRETAARLDGCKVWNINSTAEGGGVAEMLGTLLPYCAELGWDIRWAVMFGDEDFFDVTKRIHNALHGAPLADGGLDEDAQSVYASTTAANAEAIKGVVSSGDVVLIHDPQAAGLIAPLLEHGARVSWQCHIGTDDPNDNTRTAWDFLRSYVSDADRYVFTRESYLWDGLDSGRLRIIPPSIDALSAKNMSLTEEQITNILRAAHFLTGDPSGPAEFRCQDGRMGRVERPVDRVGGELQLPESARIVLQVSRWDRLKDPIGCIRIFVDHLSEIEDLHLVHAGPSTADVDDDPEGAEVLAECSELWKSLPAELQERVHLISVPMDDVEENAVIINAMQRYADVVLQKSLQEGFGLTVSEAMWKQKPVVASRVGGIQDQIEDGKSGILVDDPADLATFAREIKRVLSDDEMAASLGREAYRRVCDDFLGPRQLMQYSELINELVR
jgi:trehalose synthase